ncbi:hypothetical protein DVK05_12780 [Halorubrum sp. Atlit-8R]|uniref:hypothetical protein n=1 Tax=unclassified Halorubrum TaxID=2642239 RepID=UPI000EF208B2|nr:MULTISPECIES: hypothetical protein [unclassified Halorubrum]RLM63785.1 hypothetical protein DVK08_14525 [Halorubrum sp. Atlit-9R]RLM77163.1 hypothetical protein DVK05_12780 [Halorubrum sp. Atlit-8R]
MTPRRVAVGVFDLALALTLGAAARLAHVFWYRLFETSVAVDLAGSVALGAVFGLGHVLVASGDRVFGPAGSTVDSWVWRPRRTAAAFGVGFLLHASIVPAFTPFGLEPAGVNAVLTVGGVAVGLWSLAVRRAAR